MKISAQFLRTLWGKIKRFFAGTLDVADRWPENSAVAASAEMKEDIEVKFDVESSPQVKIIDAVSDEEKSDMVSEKSGKTEQYQAAVGEETARDTFDKILDKKTRARPAIELASMGDLLACLDETFAALRLPFSKFSWVRPADVDGLRKMGVHVVHPAHQQKYRKYQAHDQPTVPQSRILPSMLCVSFGWSMFDSGDLVYSAVIFAIKENKLPAWVNKCIGQHYLFGIGCKAGISSSKDQNKTLFWLAGYMTVRGDGSLYLHKEILPRQHTIKLSAPAARRSSGRTVTYTTKGWGTASLAQLFVDHKVSCQREFAAAMNFWIDREENWSVAVKKDGERLTFSIPKELTAKFFKDRIKVTNENGATRRIIHFVNAHERATENGNVSVKAHIRGLDTFDWKGYGCRVTAPNLNGRLSSGFTVAGTAFDDGEEITKDQYIDLKTVGTMLADLEEGRFVA